MSFQPDFQYRFMVMQVLSAIGTDEQPRKHIVLAIGHFAPTQLTTHLLNLLKGRPIPYRLMDILEHHHILRVIFQSLFVLVGNGVGLKIDDVPTIFLHIENLDDRRRTPNVGSPFGCCSGFL